MLENLKKAIRDRETVTIGGGVFSPQEVQQFVQEYQKLAGRDCATRRTEQVSLVAAILPLAAERTYGEFANVADMCQAARWAVDQANITLEILDQEKTQ